MKRLEDREWWPELVSLKDVFSLRELAERYGAAPAAIANALRRNKLDRAPAPSGPRVHRSQTWKAAAEQALQTSPEPESAPEVAEEVAPTPAPAPVAVAVEPRPASANGELRGYRVVIDHQAFIVVAPDVVHAAERALQSGRGEVTTIELLGVALAA